MGEESTPHQLKICSYPPTSKNFPVEEDSNRTKFLSAPTTKQQFSSYISIKTAFSAVVIALAPFLF